MKRIFFLLLAALVISGAAWAQMTEPGVPTVPSPLPLSNNIPSAIREYQGGLFDAFDAVLTTSTEARYSAGIFGSDIDDYITVNWYDPEIGTFVFLGGFPSGNFVDQTDFVTPNPYTLNFGLGKTLSMFTLGVYYAGSLVDATGSDDGATKETKASDTAWKNQLAVLVGTKGFGAFRVDFILNTQTKDSSYGGKQGNMSRIDAPSVALTWGGIQLLGMDPYVTVGYKFADKYIFSNESAAAGISHRESTYTAKSYLGFQAGVNYDLDANSSVSGDLAFKGVFGDSHKGDDVTAATGKVNWTNGGGFGIGLRGSYKYTMDLGMVAFGFSPGLALGYVNTNNDVTGTPKGTHPAPNYFQLASGVDLGIKVQPVEKVALFTGASLRLLDWRMLSYSGGKKTPGAGDSAENKRSYWSLNGFAWDSDPWNSKGNKYGNSTLGFGMTLTPAQGLVFGCGLNTFLDKLFIISLTDLTVESGSFWGKDAGNVGTFASYLFQDLVFDLTISYKF